MGSFLAATPAQALSDTGTGGVFVPVAGARIVDSAMTGKQWKTVQVAGKGGVPSDGSAGAVSVVATLIGISKQGLLTGRPNADKPSTTMGIYGGENNQNTSFSAVLAVNSDGTIQVSAETNARLLLDVQGYYTANTDGTAPGGFVPMNGSRIVDTRNGTGAPKAALTSGKTVDLQVGGVAGVPKDASAVIVNMIAANTGSTSGYFTPYPTGSTRPPNSFNYAGGGVATSMQAQVKLSSAGKLTVFNQDSTADLVLEVQGYFTAAGRGGAVFTPGAGRAYDTRTSGNTVMGKNETRSIQIAGKAGVPVMGSGINAVVLTLTALKSTAGNGNATVWADGTTRPSTTSINFDETTIRTNTITVPLGANGKVSLNNVADATNYVFDVQGWYSNPSPAVIQCGSIAPGAWLKTIPSGGVDCTITATPADRSGESITLMLDQNDPVNVALSETTKTSIPVHVPDTPGRHLISVNRDQADGTVMSGAWFATFGDWTTSSYQVTPEDGSTSSAAPSLRIWTEDSTIPNDATYVYKIWDTLDTTAAPIASQDGLQGGWDLPAGLLSANKTYYWSAQATATLDGQQGQLTTALSSFTTDSSAPDQGGAPADADSYPAPTDGDDTASPSTATFRRSTISPSVQLASTTRLMHTASVPGPVGEGLRCNKDYNYSTFNGELSLRRDCGAPRVKWGFRASVIFCSGATSKTHETGMQWWDHTSRTSAKGSPHDEYYCTYWFHGVMSNIQVGHQISYYDYISFRKTVAGRPGTAWVDCSGIFIVTNRTR
ncbi:hypothetical protein [Curtobacterium citreum]|uniref:Fibronectin type-III domain-containing protein n=1 Tax=Curtobacterium citreum TaxID=2036 RepID=A0ABT2HH40_9MICO|nr:hypothetical protein [Curtobacterium citreum]MCS6522585.1 hypothetical protein [Curtobacterium citreum]